MAKYNVLAHFMPFVSEKQKNLWFLDIFRGTGRDQWHEMG